MSDELDNQLEDMYERYSVSFYKLHVSELKDQIAQQEAEITRLKEKCDKQAAVLRRLTPDKYPGVLFIHGHLGKVDANGLPDKLLVVPEYGCDWSQVYVKEDRILGGMGS